MYVRDLNNKTQEIVNVCLVCRHLQEEYMLRMHVTYKSYR